MPGFFSNRKKFPGYEDILTGWEYDPTMSAAPFDLSDRAPIVSDEIPSGDAPKKKGGFFKKGGGFADILGYMADGLAGNSNYGDQVQQARQSELQEKLAQRRRQEELVDYRAKKEIDQQYRAPKDPSEFDQMLTAAGITDPIERQKAYNDLVTNRREGSPYQFDVTGDGLPDIVPRSEYRRMMGGGDMPAPKTAQERDALPPGTRYRAPDGTVKVKGGASQSSGSPTFLGY